MIYQNETSSIEEGFVAALYQIRKNIYGAIEWICEIWYFRFFNKDPYLRIFLIMAQQNLFSQYSRQ